MIVATFGIRDADLSPLRGNGNGDNASAASDTMVQCSRCAMKLALLAQKYRRQMIRYEMNTKNTTEASKIGIAETNNPTLSSMRLRTHVGIHSCSIPVSSPLPSEMRPQNSGHSESSDDDEEARRQSNIEPVVNLPSIKAVQSFQNAAATAIAFPNLLLNPNDANVIEELVCKWCDSTKSLTLVSTIQGEIRLCKSCEQALNNGEEFAISPKSLARRNSRLIGLGMKKESFQEGEWKVVDNDEEMTTTSTVTSGATAAATVKKDQSEVNQVSETELQQGAVSMSRVLKDTDKVVSNLHIAHRKQPIFEGEDESLIYKIDDAHVDFSVELSWMAKEFHLEVVISPQAMVLLDRSETVQMKDIIVRDLDILRSNAYPTRPCLKVFELIAFEHVGSHDPGLLKAIRHYETGLKKYRKRRFKEALINFQSAIAISDDAPSAVLHLRSKEYEKQPPNDNWSGEWELSRSQYQFDEDFIYTKCINNEASTNI